MIRVADLVKCNNCDTMQIVERIANKCDKCKMDGGLMDICQDIEVDESYITEESKKEYTEWLKEERNEKN